MAREAKIGLVVIGILLFVFTGLLVKRMMTPTSLPVAKVPAKTKDTVARLPKPEPPTLVTAKAESAKPPELVDDDQTNSASSAAARWARRRGESPTTNVSTPPSVLQTPLMSEIRDRYASMRPAGISATAQPHRSAYPSASDDGANGQKGGGSTAPAEKSYGSNSSGRSPRGTQQVDLSHPAPRYGGSFPVAPVPSQPTAGGPPSANDRDLSNPHDRYVPTPADQSYRASPRESSWATPSLQGQYDSKSADNSQRPPVAVRPVRAPYADGYSRAFPAATPTVMRSTTPRTGPVREEEYTVEPNDSFWMIAEKVYGDGAYFKALYEHNRKRFKNADDLTVGDTLLTPDEPRLRRMYPDLCPKPRAPVASTQQRLASASRRLQGGGRVYTVVEGDTLFEIARYELGKAARWGEIYDLNRDVLGKDFDYLRPGTELILPDDNTTRTNITRQPSDYFSR